MKDNRKGVILGKRTAGKSEKRAGDQNRGRETNVKLAAAAIFIASTKSVLPMPVNSAIVKTRHRGLGPRINRATSSR
jgi:hypothetical protein